MIADLSLSPAPAQDIIQYEARTFTSSLDYSKTEYQGPPSERNNAAWDALFVHGLTRVTAEEAAPMYNKTLPIPDDPDHYIVSLAVFHQLHCLVSLNYSDASQILAPGCQSSTK